MTERETNLRSILFLVIGILLLLSLIICIYIVSAERDLIKISAEVVDIDTNRTSTGKIKLVVNYEVNEQPYKYDNYMFKGEVKVGDKVQLYYHEKNPSSVQPFKTNKLIFIFPIVGLVLCILGLFELFKKSDDNDNSDFETSVISVVGNTQQLRIVTDNADVASYKPTPEEIVEAPVKTLVKEVAESNADSSEITLLESDIESNSKHEVVSDVEKSEENIVVSPADVNSVNLSMSVSEVSQDKEVHNAISVKEQNVNVKQKSSAFSEMEKAIVQKVKSETNGANLNEDEIREVIKAVLKEVIAEVKEEQVSSKPLVQKKVIPKNYYISGTSLIYEEAGKGPQEIELKTVKSIVRTINSAGNVVKLVVSNDAVKCILTNMKNIDLEQLASLLNNKMRTIDDSFNEEIEYKEY